MLAPAELYPVVHAWLQAGRLIPQALALGSVANLVTALLVGQRLRYGSLARTHLSPAGVTARQRYRRVRRVLTRPWLSSAWLTPRLVPVVLALVPDPVPHLAMDTVRCGAWEVLTIGVVWHGRVLLVGWAVLPYPMPKGQFSPTVRRLLRRVAAAWPADRARPHLVADRGFPSLALFRLLVQLEWGWTIRLRCRLTVGVAGQARALREVVAASTPGAWTCQPSTYGTGRQAVAGYLVIGRGEALPILPAHQANPGSLRHRARQWLLRQREVRDKRPGHASAAALASDRWMVLFTSHPRWLAASRSYTQRWSAEGSYRDAQSGYDRQHGWELEPTLTREPNPAVVDAVVGLWALGALLQTVLGAQVGQARDPLVQQARARWTTTGRLSVWMRGRFALADPDRALHTWLLATLQHSAEHLRQALGRPAPRPQLLAAAA